MSTFKMIKKLFLILYLIIPITLPAQENSWPQNYETFKTEDTGNSLAIIYFSGSDWCKPCIKFMDEILLTDEFLSYSKKFRLYQADFPYRKKLPKAQVKFNESLAKKYNQEGLFPKFIILDNTGVAIFQTGYKEMSTGDFIDLLETSVNTLKK